MPVDAPITSQEGAFDNCVPASFLDPAPAPSARTPSTPGSSALPSPVPPIRRTRPAERDQSTLPPALLDDPLACLGLHGTASIATPILASLVTGDPCLLVGARGTAKTALAEALAEALGLRFRAYDASKALFEDIIGFPNPRDLGRGRIGYVATDI